MRTVFAYIEDHLVLPVELCRWTPCMNDSSICGCYEGPTASGEAILCSLDGIGEAEA